MTKITSSCLFNSLVESQDFVQRRNCVVIGELGKERGHRPGPSLLQKSGYRHSVQL